MSPIQRTYAERIAREDDVSISMTQTVHFPPCAFDASMLEAIESTANAYGYPNRRLASGGKMYVPRERYSFTMSFCVVPRSCFDSTPWRSAFAV